MSLVGPRPWPPSMVANQVQQGLTYRNDFVAGWTGPAQVQKGSIESAGFAQLDSEYVAAFGNLGAWTLLRRDLALLSATFRTIARGEGLQVLVGGCAQMSRLRRLCDAGSVLLPSFWQLDIA